MALENEAVVLFFSDQSVNNNVDLREILDFAESSAATQQFLKCCDDVFRKEIARLPKVHRETFGPFLGLKHQLTLVTNGVEDTQIPKGTLLCIAQLICLLSHAEKHPDILSHHSKTIGVGLCTGLLPALAAAFSESIIQLKDIAVELAAISFRLEWELRESARAMVSDRGSWAVAYSDLVAENVRGELLSLQNSKSIPVGKQVYVSVSGASSVTLSGPPSSLESVISNMPLLNKKSKTALPITGPFHAPHLSTPDLDAVIGSSKLLHRTMRPNASVLSTSTGKPFSSSTDLRDLLHEALNDVLSRCLRLDLLSDTLIQSAKTLKPRALTIGPVNSTKFLTDALGNDRNEIKSDALMNSLYKQAHESGNDEHFAIVGMAGRFPGADSVEEFWTVLERAKAMHKHIPKDRFDVATHVDPTGNSRNTSLTPWGAFVDSAPLFDNALFNISPKEAPQMDPMHRLLLMTTFEALESSGYQKDRTASSHHSRIGTYFGCSSDDWRQTNSAQDIDAHFIPGANRCFGPGRLNYFFDWEGPSYSIDTACSSSSAAIQLALNGIRSGDCETAIAGGSSVSTCSDIFAGLSRGGFLSQTGPCKTFLEGGDGYCRADAVACIVIKRLEAARADNDRILAVLRSCSSNHSAKALSLTRPHAPTQESLFRKTLHLGNVKPSQVDYVEMHGTGTVAGDAGESTSVSNVFLKDALARKDPFYVGSIKPNVGHSEAASGVSSVIKALCMLKHGIVPPHIIDGQNFNPNLPTGFTSLIPRKRELLAGGPKADRNRMILINNFNAAGGNTSLVLEEQGRPAEKRIDPRDFHIVIVSAKTSQALKGNLQRLSAYVKKNGHKRISDLAYTTTARRMHQSIRKTFVSNSMTDLKSQLQDAIADPNSNSSEVRKAPTTVFAFAGQGDIHADMGRKLFETSATFRNSILKADKLCQQLELPSFLDQYFSNSSSEPSKSIVTDHLALVALEIALYDLWTSLGFHPDIVTGHSLGEYTALYVAKALSLSDLLFLIGKRAELMEANLEANTHSMLVARCSSDQCLSYMGNYGERCEIACYNGPNSAVISGPRPDIDDLESQMKAFGVKSLKLQLSYAFHSPQMNKILREVEAQAQHVCFGMTQIPLASGLHGSVLPRGTLITPHVIAEQTRKPVMFHQAIESAMSGSAVDPNTLWVEFGPGSSCLSMVKSILNVQPSNLLASQSKQESPWSTLSKSLGRAYEAGVNISWPDFHRDFEQHHLTFLEIPTYSFDLKHYWIQYEGDWMITKNLRPVATPSPGSELTPVATSSLQRVIREFTGEESVSVILSTESQAANFSTLLNSHTLLGYPVCSLSIYVDMAFAAAIHAARLLRLEQSAQTLQIKNMTTIQPMCTKTEEPNSTVQVSLAHDIGASTYQIGFEKQQSGTNVELSGCEITTLDPSACRAAWNKLTHLVTSRIDVLRASSFSSISKLSHSMIYKMLDESVAYSQKFQGMDEVFFDADTYEAVAHITFKTEQGEDAMYAQCPYWTESLFQISFLVLNATHLTPRDSMFVLSGWDNLMMPIRLESNERYISYVKMRPDSLDAQTMTGDVYVLDSSLNITAVCEGLSYHLIKKATMTLLLDTAEPTTPETTPEKKVERWQASQFSQLEDDSPKIFAELVSPAKASFGPSVPRPVHVPAPLPTPPNGYESDPRGLIRDSQFPQKPQFLQPRGSRALTAFSDATSVRSLSQPPSRRQSLKNSADDNAKRAHKFKQVLASEMGIEASAIASKTQLSDLGLDSILGLSALASLKRHGYELERDFFFTHGNWQQIEDKLFPQ